MTPQVKRQRLGMAVTAGTVMLATALITFLLPERVERATDEGRAASAIETSMPQEEPTAHISQAPVVRNVKPQPALTDQSDAGNFACRALRMDFLIALQNQSVPPEVLRMIACGQQEQAVGVLLEMSRSGDLNAYAALGETVRQCDRLKRSDHDQEKEEYQLLQRLDPRKDTPQIRERVRELFRIRLRDSSAEALAFCSRLDAERLGLRDGFAVALNRAFGRPLDPAIDGPNIGLAVLQKLATDGNPAYQLMLARMLLADGRLDKQSEATHWLRGAAESLPDAKAELAACLVQGCPTPSGDVVQARQLFEEAAMLGSRLALSALSNDQFSAKRGLDLKLPAHERYAWQQLHEALTAAGCFGTEAYLSWLTTGLDSSDVDALSAAENTDAQIAATNLQAAHLASIRKRIGCFD
jgi:hypothetical protein